MLIKKQVEETVEVSLPFFSVEEFFGSKTYYAVYETVSFSVIIGSHVCNVSIVNDCSKITEAIRYEPITEMDFDFAYQMAIERLKKSVNPTEKAIV